MTPLEATYPEPLCDLKAQLTALGDRFYPKRAVWISSRTPFWMARELGKLDLRDDLITWWRFPGGMLVTADWWLVERLEANPCEETLADILGYTMPKSEIGGIPVVVQALHEDCVIWEQIVSCEGAPAAVDRASRLAPQTRMLSMLECLRRRRRLIEEEQHAAEKEKDPPPGRGAAA